MTYRQVGNLGNWSDYLAWDRSLTFRDRLNPLNMLTAVRTLLEKKREYGLNENAQPPIIEEEPKPKTFPWLFVGIGGVAAIGVGYIVFRQIKKRKK